MEVDERLTEEEAEKYDRQIRLWGLEAQKRYRYMIPLEWLIKSFLLPSLSPSFLPPCKVTWCEVVGCAHAWSDCRGVQERGTGGREVPDSAGRLQPLL